MSNKNILFLHLTRKVTIQISIDMLMDWWVILWLKKKGRVINTQIMNIIQIIRK